MHIDYSMTHLVLLDSPWYPFNHLPEYAEKYKVQTHELIQTLNIQDFKLP